MPDETAFVDWSKPSADEFEVTLLGRMGGESCVVHYGDDRWMIVDSFNVGSQAAALTYLNCLEVGLERVEHIVVTHFHADHYRGIDTLQKACPHARLWVTEALPIKKLGKLDANSKSPLVALKDAIRQAKQRSLTDTLTGFVRLKAGMNIVTDATLHIQALAPSEYASNEASLSLATALGESAKNIQMASNDNRSSVVLSIEFDGIGAILGGHLENGPPGCGWQALLDEYHAKRFGVLQPAQLIKVPHHGSPTAHYHLAWSQLISNDALMLVAPNSNTPKMADQVRLLRYGKLWLTRPRPDAASPASPISANDAAQPGGTRQAPVGIVCARRSASTPWEVRCSGSALEA